MRRRLGLRSKLALAFLAVLAPVLALEIVDYFGDLGGHRESVLQGSLGTAQAIAALVDATFDQATDVAQSLAIDPVVLSLDGPRIESLLARYAPLYPHYDSINVWDAGGGYLGASAPQPAGAPRPTITDREHFRRTMATGKPTVSEVIIARTTGGPAAAAIVPVSDASGRRVGAVSVLVKLDLLPSRLQQTLPSSEQAIVVADPTGRLAVHTLAPGLRWEDRDASSYAPMRAALSSGMFTGTERGILSPDAHVVALVRTPKYGWVAGVLTPETVALAPLRARAAQSLLADVAVLALVVILALLVSRGMTRPLEELTGVIRAFGRGDLGQRASVRTGDELETVGETFNQMASALQEQQERLRFMGELGSSLAALREPDPMVQLLASRLAEFLRCGCITCLYANGGDECRSIQTHASSPSQEAAARELASLAHPRGGGPFSALGERVEPLLWTGDPAAAELDEGVARRLIDLGIGSLIVAPFRVHGRRLGLLAAFATREDRQLDQRMLQIAREVADVAAVAIESALLFEEVQRDRGQIDALIERVGEGITIVDGAGRVVRLNHRARELLGAELGGEGPATLEEQLLKVDLRYPSGAPVPFSQRPIARAIRGEVFSGEEYIVARPDGTELHLLVSSGVVRDATGVQLAMTIYMDITPIRDLERAREEFISVVAHDLRTPITTIMGFASTLRQLPAEMRGAQQEQRALDAILSSSKRLNGMVSDLLDASRIESKRLAISREPTNLPALLHEVVERAAEITAGHPVRLQVRGEIPVLKIDPARIEQVMDNLLSNAAKYSFPESEIAVSVERVGGEAVVSVTNLGEGVAPEEAEAVFSRFHRAQSARRSRAAGLGLGLYVTRGLVEAHGGRTWVESEVGSYATFRFTLPVTE